MEEDRDAIVEVLYIIVLIFALTIFIGMCSSCGSTRYVTKEIPKIVTETVHDTLRVTQYIHTSDTLIVRDSVAPNDKGGIDRWHSEYGKSKDRQRDTIYKNKEIRVPEPFEVTKEVVVEVEKKRPLWEQIKDALAYIGIGILLAIIGGVVWRRRLKV